MKRYSKTYENLSQKVLTAIYYGFIPLVVILGIRSTSKNPVPMPGSM